MNKPTSNYKGMGGGPIGKRLAQTKMPRPTILHAGGGRGMGSKVPKSYHPPTGGGHRPHMGNPQAEEKAVITQTIKAAKAQQGMSIAEQQVQLVEEAMKRMGISLDHEPMGNEGGL